MAPDRLPHRGSTGSPAFEMSRAARTGHNLAASWTVFTESIADDQGYPRLAEQGLSLQEMLGRMERLVALVRQDPASVSHWAEASSVFAQFAGDLGVREEFRVDTGDEIGRAA